jgi:hypothetical protein
MTEPITVIAAYSHIRKGLLIERPMSARSLTSGRDRNDESQIAISINPGAPHGSRVVSSHCDIAFKYDI